ncbi:SRPBCC family protein [Nonomuraea longicatena]|uniref:Activator of Hsp90 ATPase homologue 1/2-like C-terminal domain-containing protein n=1 Tax=Nonomuraea longicatena TaxID=83682 RepID=A0ABN1NKQ6_9ACTN
MITGQLGSLTRGAVHLDRVLKAPPARVWAMWTEPERLARWLGPVESGAPGPGATFTLGMEPGVRATCTVTAWEPERLLELDWHYPGEGDSRLRITLEPAEGGTRLVLDHDRLDDAGPVEYGAGWHTYLDLLAADLEERQAPRFDERFRELRAAYGSRSAGLSGGRNIAMKVPTHQWESTVAFYRDVVGLPEIEAGYDGDIQTATFEFGANTLWVDRVETASQAEIWLELTATDLPAAGRHLAESGVPRRDEVEPLPADSGAFWISSPASIIHLVAARD